MADDCGFRDPSKLRSRLLASNRRRYLVEWLNSRLNPNDHERIATKPQKIPVAHLATEPSIQKGALEPKKTASASASGLAPAEKTRSEEALCPALVALHGPWAFLLGLFSFCLGNRFAACPPLQEEALGLGQNRREGLSKPPDRCAPEHRTAQLPVNSVNQWQGQLISALSSHRQAPLPRILARAELTRRSALPCRKKPIPSGVASMYCLKELEKRASAAPSK